MTAACYAVCGGRDLLERDSELRRLDGRMLPGALLADLDSVDRTLHDVPLDQELVSYCNCPNEAASAGAARALMAKGYRHVRPLQGGLEARAAAGYPVQRLVPAIQARRGNAARSQA